LDNNFNSFDNLETSIRKSSVIQERINLVSTHMYKQFLEYQRSTMNSSEMFVKIADNMEATVEYLKQSFSARGVSTDSIYFEQNDDKTVIVLHILWHHT
jgi:5'-deoxynucleotidase YfbR-like HD superfamily hydrolase